MTRASVESRRSRAQRAASQAPTVVPTAIIIPCHARVTGPRSIVGSIFTVIVAASPVTAQPSRPRLASTARDAQQLSAYNSLHPKRPGMPGVHREWAAVATAHSRSAGASRYAAAFTRSRFAGLSSRG